MVSPSLKDVVDASTVDPPLDDDEDRESPEVVWADVFVSGVESSLVDVVGAVEAVLTSVCSLVLAFVMSPVVQAVDRKETAENRRVLEVGIILHYRALCPKARIFGHGGPRRRHARFVDLLTGPPLSADGPPGGRYGIPGAVTPPRARHRPPATASSTPPPTEPATVRAPITIDFLAGDQPVADI